MKCNECGNEVEAVNIIGECENCENDWTKRFEDQDFYEGEE